MKTILPTYSDQDPLVLEVDVGDGKLVGERHGCDVFRLDEQLTVSQEADWIDWPG